VNTVVTLADSPIATRRFTVTIRRFLLAQRGQNIPGPSAAPDGEEASVQAYPPKAMLLGVTAFVLSTPLNSLIIDIKDMVVV
jgi:hypothetical protein